MGARNERVRRSSGGSVERKTKMTTATLDEELVDGFEIDSDGIAPEAVYKGGGNTVSKEGMYHFTVLDVAVEKKDGKVPCVKVDCQVLAGDHEDQTNKLVYHRIRMAKGEYAKDGSLIELQPLDERGKKAAIRWMLTLGLITEDDLGKKLKPNWKAAIGRQFIGKVARNEFDAKKDGQKTGEKRTSYEIAWGDNVWPVDHEEVANVPKDANALAMLTGGMGVGATDFSDI